MKSLWGLDYDYDYDCEWRVHRGYDSGNSIICSYIQSLIMIMGNGCWKQVYKIIKIIYKYTFIWIREYIIWLTLCHVSVCMVSAVNVSGSGNTFLISSSSFSSCFIFLHILFFYLNMNLTSSIYGYNVQMEIQFHALHIQFYCS